jgi:hypothetical protein
MSSKPAGHILAIITIFISCSLSFGQGGNSPYSILGIGDLVPRNGAANIGMGGVSIAHASPLYGNLVNPANLVYNRLTFFDVGYFTEIRNSTSRNSTQRDIGGNISYLAFGFPVTKNWTMSAGLRPLSSVNYEVFQVEKLPNTPTFVTKSYVGEGGINQVYWSHGVQLFKGFSIGVELAYNFGSISKQSRSTLEDGAEPRYVVGLLERTSYSQLTFMPGFTYTVNLNKSHYISIGATYQREQSYNATVFEALQRRTISDVVVANDTLNINTSGSVNMPSELSLGLSFGKEYKYNIGVDYISQQWSQYRDFNGVQNLQDAMILRVGGEYIPDINSISSYFKRVTYRLGFAYQQLPYTVENETLEDISLSGGFSLPINRGFSSLNIAAMYGVRQTGQQDAIKENYFRFIVGFTINDRWFVRRRIN